MSNNSTIGSIFALSNTILNAQKISNIVWVVLCANGLLMSTLQIITTLFWKPLRKIDQCLILAIAVGDFVKSVGYGLVASKRLYLTSINANEVTSQKMCIVWLMGISVPTDFVFILLAMVSLDRALALVVPVWYKQRKIGFKLVLIAFSVCAAVISGSASFAGVSDTIVQPVCAYGTSPTENYRTYAAWFENGMALMTVALNLVSGATVIIRWRAAKKAKKDLKAFKKNIQLNALKTLTAVVITHLISTSMGAFWMTLLNVMTLDDAAKMSYVPLAGCFSLFRGVLDFPIYLVFVKEYRAGFKAVILNCKSNSKTTKIFSTKAQLFHVTTKKDNLPSVRNTFLVTTVDL